jgi:hypothetical protein
MTPAVSSPAGRPGRVRATTRAETMKGAREDPGTVAVRTDLLPGRGAM